MKRMVMIWVMVSSCLVLPIQRSEAQIPVLEIIKEAVTKVIVAIDLKIQRLQNETIWLQNAQKTIENKMQELKLGEIGDWVEKQRKLYANYYRELWRVKSTIIYYQKVKDIIQKQLQIAAEFKQAIALFRKDKHFTPEEIANMEHTYSGILEESIKNLDQLYLAISSFATQMTDGKRLELIDGAASNIDQNLTDLRQFNNQNIRLSLNRSKDQREINAVKTLYGIK